jgi:ribose/xylose/arabinose/galactoside ABC-type transport system permease subunit
MAIHSILMRQVKRRIDVLVIFLFMVAMIIVATMLDNVFFTSTNLLNLVGLSIPLIICAYGQTIIILLGGIDLTVGPIVSLSTVIMAAMTTIDPGSWALPFGIALGAGAIIGFTNGVIVTKGKQQAIIVTLAMSVVVGGIALAIQPNAGVVIKNSEYCSIFSGRTISFVPMLLLIIVSVIVWTTLNRTSFGRKLFATGGHEASAVASGIHVDKIKIYAFIFSGVLSALAGLYIASMMSAGDPLAGSQYTMRTITAVVIGGTSLAGGKGGIVGTIIGACIIMIINNILNFIGISTFYQYIFQGAILLVALIINALRAKRA